MYCITPFGQVIKAVRAVSPEAAAFLRALQRAPRSAASRKCYFCPTYFLDNSFIWADTPQGHEYWSNINNYLDKEYRHDQNYNEPLP